MEVEPIEAEAHEVEPSEPVILKKRGRPKGSLNKKTVAKMREDVLPDSSLHTESEVPEIMALDVDFTSDQILGEVGEARAPKPRERKPKAPPKARDPPTEPPSEDDSPPPPPITKKRPPRVKTRSDTYREQEPVYPASYLEVLTRGLKEAKAKQYADKVAQYDKFFRW